MRIFAALIAIIAGATMYLHPHYGRTEAILCVLLACAGVLYLFRRPRVRPVRLVKISAISKPCDLNPIRVKIEPSVLVAAIFIGLAGTAALRATTVVIIRTPEHIVVAADSLWSYQMGARDLAPRIGCKVRRVGNVYFTGSSTNVDGRQMEYLASQAMMTSRSPTAAADRFILDSGQLAARTAAHEKDSVIDQCWRRACAEAVFFGIEEGVPTIIQIRFEQVGHSRESLKLKAHKFSCPGHCTDRPRTILLFGRTKYIEKVAQKKSEFWQSDENTARTLVEIEKNAEPQYVGGPIDVLTLDAEGPHWRSATGGACPSEETSSAK